MNEDNRQHKKDWTKTAKKFAKLSYGPKVVRRMELERQINKMSQVFWED